MGVILVVAIAVEWTKHANRAQEFAFFRCNLVICMGFKSPFHREERTPGLEGLFVHLHIVYI
jgi:hypothetical protein